MRTTAAAGPAVIIPASTGLARSATSRLRGREASADDGPETPSTAAAEDATIVAIVGAGTASSER